MVLTIYYYYFLHTKKEKNEILGDTYLILFLYMCIDTRICISSNVPCLTCDR